MTNGTPSQNTESRTTLYMALELSALTWMLAFGDGSARKARRRTIDAGDLDALDREIEIAKEKLALSASSGVVGCYEAGRDGFWIHRALTARGVTNHVVESASIEVNRRQRRAKTDAIDVEALLRLLMRFDGGDPHAWRTVRVPSEKDEDARRVHRERERLQKEVTQLRNRILGLLATQGLRCEPSQLPKFLKEARTKDGRAIGTALVEELIRMHERLTLLCTQLKAVEKQQTDAVRSHAEGDGLSKVKRLMCLRGIGVQGAWLMVMEFFGWRQFRNRREVGALAGLTGTPFNSGGSEREQGISKAGNKRVRRMAVELAWLWVRHQPASALTRWFLERFGKGARSRKIGIVALARKLLVVLWHFIEHGVIPDGAVLTPAKGIRPALMAETKAACRAARSSLLALPHAT